MSKTVNIPANINTSGGELQNVKLQNLNTTPSNATESRIWYDSVNHKPMYHNGTEAKEFGKEYGDFVGADGTNAGTPGLVPAPDATDNTKFLKGDGTWETPTDTTYNFSTGLTNTNGTITVTDYNKLIKNISTSDSSIYVMPSENSSVNKTNAVCIGKNSIANSESATSIGASAACGGVAPLLDAPNGVAIGFAALAMGGYYPVAIGSQAQARGNSAIQIGYGTNETTNTLSIGFYNDASTHYNWQLLNGTTGLIPDDRLSSNIARASALSGYIPTSAKGANNGVATLDSSGKVPNSQLPSFVDDVIDSYIVSDSTALSAGWLSATSGGSAFTPETGKIYVVLTSGTYQNKTYRWSGSTYVEISASPGQATESAAGIAEIATQAEVTTGTDDTKFITPKKLKSYTSKIKTFAESNPALTASSGGVTWEIVNALGSADVASVRVYNVSTGETIFAPWKATTSYITIEMLSSSNVAAGTYRAVVIGTPITDANGNVITGPL